ncbi:fibronectin type III domain-containing protein, partial [Flavobacterium sp. RHBU_3]|uniref:fibronectin type III domain-containing protein n=1 Tax=Flavobacterium sp. RHBU_3 TaxID=3391184 RepID=UPI003984CA47
FTVTTTATGTTPVANIFAVSGKVIGDCPSMNTTSATSGYYATATVNWSLSSAGEGTNAADVWYRVEVYTDSAYTTPVSGSPFITSAGVSSYALSGLSANTTYYYKVYAINSSCESGAVTSSFTTPASCLPATSLTTSGASLTSMIISWTAPAYAPGMGYEYYYSTSSTAPTAATTGTAITGTSATITGLTTDTTYYWWVRSNCDGTDKSVWTGTSFYVGYCTPTYSNCDSTHRITTV